MIEIMATGALATVQDHGRYGALKWGVGASGALDNLAPAAPVGALRQPAPPVFDRGAEKLFRLAKLRTPPVLVFRIKKAQDKSGLFSLLEDKVGDHASAVGLQADGGGQTKTEVRSRKAGTVRVELSLVPAAGIIEGGSALQMK